jgi:Fe-S-cluster containining protein
MYEMLRGKRYSEPDEVVEFIDIVYPYRHDLICVFLNQKTNLCNIYPIRPQLCSAFGRKSNCFHYTSSGRRLTRAEKRSGNCDTREGVISDIEAFKKALEMKGERGVKEGARANPEKYAEIYSLAMPEMTIRAIQMIAPSMVIDLDAHREG